MRALLLCALLLLPSVAGAGPYTGIASFDLTSLVFSGIAVQPVQYSQNDELYLQPLQPEEAGSLTPFDTHGTFEDWRPFTLSSSNVSQSGMAQPNGELVSVVTDTRLATTVTLTDAGGYGVGLTERAFSFTALEAGLFTYQVDFTLSHVGVPAFTTPFTDQDFTQGTGPRGPLDFSAVVEVGAGLSGSERQSILFDASEGAGVRTGTFTGTSRFAAGEEGSFGLRTSLAVNQTQSVASVPEPHAVWLLGLGLVGLWAWRRRQV